MKSRIKRRITSILGGLTLALAKRLLGVRRPRRSLRAAADEPAQTSLLVEAVPTASVLPPPPATRPTPLKWLKPAKLARPQGERFKIAPPPDDAADLRADLVEPERLQTMPFKAIAYHEANPFTVEDAFARRLDNVVVASAGKVIKTLRTDTEGSRHQKFVIRLDSGATILITHNIDDAPRVPVRPGDRVSLRGRYIWNERGGEIHWTHHDPNGVLAGGWIEMERTGKRYE